MIRSLSARGRDPSQCCRDSDLFPGRCHQLPTSTEGQPQWSCWQSTTTSSSEATPTGTRSTSPSLDAGTGRLRAEISDRTDGPAYRRMLTWAIASAPGRRVWALEGTGSFAAGLVTVLAEAGEDVVEIQNKKRRSRGEE